MITPLQELKDTLSNDLFKMTAQVAHDRGICIKYLRPWQIGTYSPAGVREYQISGLCEECFDSLFEEKDDEE